MAVSALDQHCSDTRSGEVDETHDVTPLPWGQLLIVLLIQFAEPITAIVIFPFINQMVRETGVTGGDETKTGYFAGIIESVFFIAEATTTVFWGMASDRFGRRSVLIFGPLGLSITMLGFGASTQFSSLVIFRLFQGVFNGNMAVTKAVVAEITDRTNIADAFAYTSVMWCIGGILAPTIGGMFSRPAVHWPDSLGKLAYLQEHPYFLPCFIASAFAFIAFLAALVGLSETLPSAILQEKRQKTRKTGLRSASSISLLEDSDALPLHIIEDTMEYCDDLLTESEASAGDPEPPSLRALLLMPRVSITIINYGLFSFCDMSRRVLTPLMWSTSPEHGGLGFTPYTMGLTMGIYGIINMFVQAKFLGKAIKYFGPRKLFIVSFAARLVILSCLPLENYIARRTGGADWRVWTVIIVQLIMDCITTASYSSIEVLITDSVPCQSALGAVNGLAQAAASVSKSLAPYFASSLFALSLQRNWAGGNAVYYILIGIAACEVRLSFMLPEKLRLP